MDQTVLDKAGILIEALPYIKKFNNKKVVVKYGGSAMIDENLQKSVIQDVVLLKLVGMQPIIVHGGGKEISKWLGKIGHESKFVNGLRVTDETTMEVCEMVLGRVNKQIVKMIDEIGVRAAGVDGKDGRTLVCEKKTSDGVDIGYVGNIIHVNTNLIDTLLRHNYIPVVAPIGLDDNFHAYNINADDAACAIAQAVGAEKLAFLTDTEGVLRDVNDKDSLISQIAVGEVEDYISSGVISGGMIPKIRNCAAAVNNGVNRVHILDGRVPHSLLLEFFTDKGIGSLIKP
jgi:acetylglutamate kinase